MLKQISCPVAQHATHQTPAIITSDETISYKDLNDRITSIAATLPKMSVPLAIKANKDIQTIAFIFACFRKRIPVCLLSTRYSETQRNTALKQTHATFIENIHPKADNQTPPNTSLDLDQEATYMFTSGSSGDAKAVVHTIANHYYSAVQSNEHIPLNASDKWLLSLPIYHVGGFSILWRAFLAGATVVIDDTTKDLENIIETHRITHLSLVPTQLYRLLNQEHTPRSLKAVLTGGGPIPARLIKQSIDKKLSLYISYGLTEMTSQVATSPRITSLEDAKKVQLLKYSHIKAKSEQLYVKGKTRFKGYIKKGKLEQPFVDGWFATGDLGSIDNEGNLSIKGRKDNMFISGGENIYPEEIERVLNNDKRIEEVFVIPIKDAEFGERPVVFIRGKASREEVEQICTTQLERFKLPVYFYKLPTATNLKTSRASLRAMLDGNAPELEML